MIYFYYLINFNSSFFEISIWSLGRFSKISKGKKNCHLCLNIWNISDFSYVHTYTYIYTHISDFPFSFHFPVLEKEVATHSSVFAWRIPGTAEPGGLLSMGSHRVGHNWSDLAAAAAVSVKQIGWIQHSEKA